MRPASTGALTQRAFISSSQTHILFTLFHLAQLIRQLLINLPPMADGEDPENSRFTM
jgi:hypothetical protein